jgi:hypothetical protein
MFSGTTSLSITTSLASSTNSRILPRSLLHLRLPVEHMLCHAQGIGVLTSQYINASAVQCKLPEEKYPDEVALSLVLDNDRSVSNELYLTIVDFRVILMNPAFGGINDGTPVTFILDPRS